jgi:hypothetical protein
MRLLLLLVPILSFAQPPVITAFPSLRIPYHSRGLGMGDVGIATATENQQLYYNVAKTAFTHHFHQVAASYAPWMSSISQDSRMMNLNYLGNTSNSSALGASLTYLDYGAMNITDNNGATIISYKPREYSMGISFGLQIASTASLGASMRMIGQHVYTDAPRNIFSACGDIGYYQYMNLGDESKRLEWGLCLYNLGPKITMTGSSDKTPLPVTVGMGVGYSSVEENGNELVVGVDVVKPAVPSILHHWNALRLSVGAECGWQGSFFLRGGISFEGKDQGNRKFFSFGAGYKGFVLDQSWGIDLHYLVPFGTLAAVSPFQNAMGLTLKLNIGNFQ